MKRSGYSYCDRIALEIGVPYSRVLPIVWNLWDIQNLKEIIVNFCTFTTLCGIITS
jgi:hypothetical protein